MLRVLILHLGPIELLPIRLTAMEYIWPIVSRLYSYNLGYLWFSHDRTFEI